MSKMVLLNVRTFAGSTDLTGNTNKAEITAKVDEVDVTNFGSGGWSEFLGGLADVEIMVAGFWESGADVSFVDPALFAGLGAVGPWTMAPNGAADGALAYITNALQASYQIGDEVGKAAPFEAKMKGTTRLARGAIAHPAGTARTASGTGTPVQVGALTSSQALYVNLHVYSVSATVMPSLTVRVESDDAVGFASPVTIGTFSAATALGGQHMKIVGPFADSWFRAAYTISGAAASFLFVVSFGRA